MRETKEQITTLEQADALLEEMEKTIPQKVAVCMAHMMLKDGATILDAGCADGLATAYFALTNPNINVIGVDYDAEFIKKAKDKFGNIPNLKFYEKDLRNFDLDGQKLDAIVNLSILHEPYSFTGYRKETINEIIKSELDNLHPWGVNITRDFVLPENPDKMVYMTVIDNGENGTTPENMSYPQLLNLYSQEAMSFDDNDPDAHIKGFFYEDHTDRFDNKKLGIPDNHKIFYLPHGFAYEFIWRKEYKDRFEPESQEKYGFWTQKEHMEVPEKLGGRVLYAAPYENPWIMQNWYEPKVSLFDEDMNSLPLPPSNFISVVQKIEAGQSAKLREHRVSNDKASYLQIEHYKNKNTGALYDIVNRPGKDVVDVIPYSVIENDLIIYAKSEYPRPIINTRPRLMTPNIDNKKWSGHIIESLAIANISANKSAAINEVLLDRAGFTSDEISQIEDGLIYYTAPAELNERVSSVFAKISSNRIYSRNMDGNYSGFSNDGALKSYNATDLLASAQVGMLAEARIEMNIYELMRKNQISPPEWIGAEINELKISNIKAKTLNQIYKQATSSAVFEKSDTPSNWLGIVRSEFHEIAIKDGKEKLITKNDLEFVVPNPKQSTNTSTNSVSIIPVIKDETTGEVLIGIQKITDSQSHFPAIQQRENYSGHISIRAYRLPSNVKHIQEVPSWIADKTGIEKQNINKLGESYFPSAGIMPNRMFPYVITEINNNIKDESDFISLREAFGNFNSFQDAHTMISIARTVHALGLWDEYSNNPQPPTLKP